MKGDNQTAQYFIENLTATAWVSSIFPYLLRRRRQHADRDVDLHYIDCSQPGLYLARATVGLLGLRLDRHDFRLEDIRDEEGALVRLRITYRDLAMVEDQIVSEPWFRHAMNGVREGSRLQTFFWKAVAGPGNPLGLNRSLSRALYLIWVAKGGHRPQEQDGPTLFLGPRPWISAIRTYGNEHGVEVQAVRREWLIPPVGVVLRRLRHLLPRRFSALAARYLSAMQRNRNRSERVGSQPPASAVSESKGADSFRLAIEYYGFLNLDDSALKSDLVFWQESELAGEDILLTFNIPADPLDDEKFRSLQSHGVEAVALSGKAVKGDSGQVFAPSGRVASVRKPEIHFTRGATRLETRWFADEVSRYQWKYDYWREFFETYRIKLYATWYKYDDTHCAIADALRDVGGITTVYQRSSEQSPAPVTATAVDVFFGFSASGAEMERAQGSKISYYVVVGLIGDHRVPLLRDGAAAVRQGLVDHGAKHILAYFDENSLADSRWDIGHESIRENYRFLLQRVLTEPWFGLVIKPKVPATLRNRLGDVAELLEQAEATGRCHIWETGALMGAYPPVTAALAADVAVHGYLAAATAGIEAALADVPTLLLDREGWSSSGLYGLGEGRVVFTDWQKLWDACVEHWLGAGLPDLGQWDDHLETFDPFRDGRAAERVGTYLKMLLDSLNSGQDREAAMAGAAVRYAARWGADKIIKM